MYQEYFKASRREIPIPLLAQPESVVGSDHAVWVSNARGYSTGVALDLTAIISPKLSTALGIPYPVFGNDVPEDNGAGTIAVVAETSDRTYTTDAGSLVGIGIGAGAGELMARATFWIPGHPSALVIQVEWPGANLAASLPLPTERWEEAVLAVTKLW